MFKVFVTDAVISKGFETQPALRFSEGEGNCVTFKFGKRVYDKSAEKNLRYINMAAKAFGVICERIKKMGLKEGSHVNIWGRLDEERWKDGEEQRSRFVIIVDDIEYVPILGGNGSKKNDAEDNSGSFAEDPAPSKSGSTTAAKGSSTAPANPAEGNSGFSGFAGFGGDNSFFPG